jgi:hypothetical protein
MFEDKTIAKHIHDLMIEFRIRLADSVVLVNANCAADEAMKYKRAIGKVLGYMIIEIAEPLREKYPEFNDESMYVPTPERPPENPT